MVFEPILLRVAMRILYSAALICALVAGSSLPAAGQSLADAAKKEEERRKAVKKAGKVYTNKDLGTPSGPAPAAPPAAAPGAAPGDTAKPAEKPGEKPADEQEPPRDQAYWAGRMKELRTQLERNQTFADALQTRINSLSADFVNRDDPAQRSVLANDRQRAQAELDRLRQQIEADKKAIADLEEEARRAGVPPGWLR
jgi:hypothetical protein